MKFTDIIYKALHSKRYRVKKWIVVKPKYRRDSKGRFVGGFMRKGYTRKILDKKSPKVTSMEMLAENITANNALLRKLAYK